MNAQKYTPTHFDVSIPGYGNYEVHSTCLTLHDLIVADSDIVRGIVHDPETNNANICKLRMISSTMAARRSNLERILVHIETNLSFLVISGYEGNAAYQGAVETIHDILQRLDLMDRAIEMTYKVIKAST